jgi:hypothetical protein
MNAHVIAWRFDQIKRHIAAGLATTSHIGKAARAAAARFAAERMAEEISS